MAKYKFKKRCKKCSKYFICTNKRIYCDECDVITGFDKKREKVREYYIRKTLRKSRYT